MTRTAQLKFWLQEAPEVKTYWINLLKFLQRVYYVEVLAYTILSNHFHLCLHVTKPAFNSQDVRSRHEIAQTRIKNPRKLQPEMEEAYYRRLCDLSKFMADLNQRTALFHNRQRSTKGHFWGAPFKSKVIDANDYLLTVMTYIELNSVQAGLARRPEDFQYSSIAEINELIKGRHFDPTPKVSFLKNLPDFKRGEAYIQLTNHLNQAIQNDCGHRTAKNHFLERLVGQEGIQRIALAITKRVPEDWKKQTISETVARRSSQMASG